MQSYIDLEPVYVYFSSDASLGKMRIPVVLGALTVSYNLLDPMCFSIAHRITDIASFDRVIRYEQGHCFH